MIRVENRYGNEASIDEMIDMLIELVSRIVG
jgi:hypothetical protein